MKLKFHAEMCNELTTYSDEGLSREYVQFKCRIINVKVCIIK